MLMNRLGFAVAPLTLTIALLAGCVSHRPPIAPESAPPTVAPDVEAEATPASEPAPERVAGNAVELPVVDAPPAPRPKPDTRPKTSKPAPPRADVPGETSMLVVSTPAGGVVVIDGRPVGPAPLQVSVPVTDRGYLSRQVTVKVRFLASETTAQSHTVELTLTPLDRAPERLDFTPDGAKRTLAIK